MNRDKEWFKKQHRDVWSDFYSNLEGVGKLRDRIEDLIDQLEEPEKVVIPQWFDEWYKTLKNNGLNDRYIITQISPAFYHTTYPDYRKRNDHFNKKQWEYIIENFITMIEAVIYGYEIEKEPLFYALIKGHELTPQNTVYWNSVQYNQGPVVSVIEEAGRYKTKHTLSEWNAIGINDSNADFVEVAE